jgi:hypothetical protein
MCCALFAVCVAIAVAYLGLGLAVPVAKAAAATALAVGMAAGGTVVVQHATPVSNVATAEVAAVRVAASRSVASPQHAVEVTIARSVPTPAAAAVDELHRGIDIASKVNACRAVTACANTSKLVRSNTAMVVNSDVMLVDYVQEQAS